MAEAEVQIDASKGFLMVKGDQAFVAETLEKYKFVFESIPKVPAKPTADSASADSAKLKSNNPASLDNFSNVFDVEGEAVSILVTPPGNTMAAQARALILLFLYARHKMGLEPVTAELIKEQCKAHACFDPKNFAGHLKSQKSLVTVTGANSSMTARLTVPGRKAAEELAQKFQNAE